jgi:hypothetical protein
MYDGRRRVERVVPKRFTLEAVLFAFSVLTRFSVLERFSNKKQHIFF